MDDPTKVPSLAEYLGLSDEQALQWEQHAEREFSSWADNLGCDARNLTDAALPGACPTCGRGGAT